MPWFWKKSPHSVYLWVKISIQNVVSRLSRRKSFKSFPCEAFFLLKVLTKCLSKCPICPKPPLPWKISHYTPAFSGSFWTSLLNPNKNPIRNSLFDKWVSFDKCFFPINFAIICQYDAQIAQHRGKKYFLAWISLLSEYIDISCLFICKKYSVYFC